MLDAGAPKGKPEENDRTHSQPEAESRKADGGKKVVTADAHGKKPQGGKPNAEAMQKHG